MRLVHLALSPSIYNIRIQHIPLHDNRLLGQEKNENILESNVPPINTWPQVVVTGLKKHGCNLLQHTYC